MYTHTQIFISMLTNTTTTPKCKHTQCIISTGNHRRATSAALIASKETTTTAQRIHDLSLKDYRKILPDTARGC
eukprot:c29323_g1_i1 orf=1-219(-)